MRCANPQGSMARRRYQKGQLYLCGQMWYGRYREDLIRDGRVQRVRKNIPLGTKKEYPTKRLAERRMEQVLCRINSTDYRPGRVATVVEFAERWRAEVLSKRKPSTQEAANSHLRHHIIPNLGQLRLEALGVENQQMFVTRIAATVSRKTALNVMGTLSSLLRTAKNWGYICEGVDVSKLVLPERGVRKEARCFTADQARRIIAAADHPWKLMFAIAAYTGLRAGEVLGLRAEDVDLERRTIRVTQTAWCGRIQTAKTMSSENTVPIPEALCQLLRPGLPGSGLLFVNRRGRPFTAEKVVQLRLWPILDALGIPRAGFHAFRHMHTTLLLESGASPKVAQRQLRHSDARTTLEIYAHLIDGAQRLAVEKVATYLN